MPHIHELYDFAVSAFIVYRQKVLLVNHPRYDKWLPIGGHVELNEDPEEALMREIHEESGLSVRILQTAPDITGSGIKFIPAPAYVEVHEANPPHKHIAMVYFGVATDDNSIKSAEHTDMRWFTTEDLTNPMYNLPESIQFYCKQALKLSIEQ